MGLLSCVWLAGFAVLAGCGYKSDLYYTPGTEPRASEEETSVQTGDESGIQTGDESGVQPSDESGVQPSDESSVQIGDESGTDEVDGE